MNKNRLTYGMAFFFLSSFVLLGLIIVNEKKVDIMIPIVEEKMESFIEENYSAIKEEVNYHSLKYNEKKKRFEQKIESKKNSHLYFYLYYKRKKITSTYERDYQKGKTLLDHLEKILTNEIKEENTTIKIKTPLDQFTPEVKERLLKEEKIKEIKVYTVERNIKVSLLETQTIVKALNEMLTEITKNGLIPKNYTITLTNNNDITQSIKIEDLNLPNNNIIEIITSILANDKTIETKYNIKYKFLN